MPKPIAPILLFLSFIIYTLISCSKKDKETKKVIDALVESLESSNIAINISTQIQLKDLEDKSTEACSKETGDIWLPKSQRIVQETKYLYDHAEVLKSKEEISELDYAEIISKTLRFKNRILSIDPEVNDAFPNAFEFLDKIRLLLGVDPSKSDNKFIIHDKSLLIAILCKIQNEIKKVENKTVAFCNTKVGCNIMTFYSYAAIIGQNSNYLKPGSFLVITAGIGAYSKSSMPRITINRKEIDLNYEGYSTYKVKVPAKPGRYHIPVQIKYFDQYTGKDEKSSVNVEYTVADTCRL